MPIIQLCEVIDLRPVNANSILKKVFELPTTGGSLVDRVDVRRIITAEPDITAGYFPLTSYWVKDPAAGCTCANCREWHVMPKNFCSNCGARMEAAS